MARKARKAKAVKKKVEDVAETAPEVVEEVTNTTDKEEEEVVKEAPEEEQQSGKLTLEERKKKLADLRSRMVRLTLNSKFYTQIDNFLA